MSRFYYIYCPCLPGRFYDCGSDCLPLEKLRHVPRCFLERAAVFLTAILPVSLCESLSPASPRCRGEGLGRSARGKRPS